MYPFLAEVPQNKRVLKEHHRTLGLQKGIWNYREAWQIILGTIICRAKVTLFAVMPNLSFESLFTHQINLEN